MKQLIKKAGSGMLYRLGLLPHLPFATRILAFHRVNPEHFERQISYLRKNYRIVPLSEARNSSNRNCVVLTFDDGYRNNYMHAYPVLKKYSIPATIFVVYNFAENNAFAWWDKVEHYKLRVDISRLKKLGPEKIEEEVERELKKQGIHPGEVPEEYAFMNWEEINEIKDVFEIGSHTINHPILTNIPPEEADKEIAMSKSLIERKISAKVKSFAYPNGSRNSLITRMAEKAGYETAVCYEKGPVNAFSNPFDLYRRGINITDTLPVFAAKAAGVF